MNSVNLERNFEILSHRMDALQEVVLEMMKMASLHAPSLREEIEQRLEQMAEDFEEGGLEEEANTIDSLLGDFTERPSA